MKLVSSLRSKIIISVSAILAITIGLGIAICGAVIVWGGIERTLAGANQDAEHRASRRIQNGIHGLVWMILASVIVSTITAIAVAYGLIDKVMGKRDEMAKEPELSELPGDED